MSYLTNFERSFSTHTLALVEGYAGPYDATMMINCLLGLLVMPKETMLQAIPEDPLDRLADWGVNPSSIKNPGLPTRSNRNPNTLRGLVTNLRHAVAHFQIKPVPATGEVTAFEYTNESGLHAVITIAEMRELVRRLSAHLAKQ